MRLARADRTVPKNHPLIRHVVKLEELLHPSHCRNPIVTRQLLPQRSPHLTHGGLRPVRRIQRPKRDRRDRGVIVDRANLIRDSPPATPVRKIVVTARAIDPGPTITHRHKRDIPVLMSQSQSPHVAHKQVQVRDGMGALH